MYFMKIRINMMTGNINLKISVIFLSFRKQFNFQFYSIFLKLIDYINVGQFVFCLLINSLTFKNSMSNIQATIQKVING